MIQPPDRHMKIIQHILGIFMVASFIFFLLGEIFGYVENKPADSTFRIFESEWVQVMPDGTRQPIDVPGNGTANKGEWITLSTILPADQEDSHMCVRSLQQELNIYIGDELRKSYSTLDTQPFGKTSTMTYVFFPLYARDAGKELRVEYSSDSSYANYFSEIYTGTYDDIVGHFFELYAPAAILSAFMFVISLLVIFCSLFVRIYFKREIDLLHLGNGLLIASTWLLVESKLRQFLFPNSTYAMLMGFLMIALLPFPFICYVNSIQKNRYRKYYITIGVCTIVNFVLTIALQVLHIKDFFEIMTSSHVTILAVLIAMFVTTAVDISNGHIREYREVAIGFLGLILAGVCEITLVYIVDTQVNGVALCIGLVIVLLTAGMKTIRDLLNMEREKQSAIAASESKAKFLANMSHEIRTPINTIIGMNEMILRENESETVSEYATNIKNASEMLLCLVNDVLDFSKIEAGKMQIMEAEYSLSSMIQDIELATQLRAKSSNIQFKLKVEDTLPSALKGDEIRIKQIMNNLLSNAFKYTKKGSVTFSVKGERSDKGFTLVLSVADTGIGIKTDDLNKLYDSFQRLELGRNRYIQGSGLGLNIAKQLIDCMNGTIDVRSTYGKGTTFTVRLPQEIIDDTPIGADKPAVPAPSVAPAPAEHFRAPGAKILIVDDTPMNLKVIQLLLKNSEMDMDFASGGDECLSKTKQTKYDIILMDHMMPEPDGVETLHLIRADADNPNRSTTIIVLTANAIAGMKEYYLSEGFADYLSKPVSAQDLESMLAKYLT